MIKALHEFIDKKLLIKLTVVFLAWRISQLVLGLLAPKFLPYEYSFPYWDTLLQLSGNPAWIYSWANFDGVHYLTIVEHGYVGTGLIQAFFPLYPILLKLLSYLVTNHIISGLIISNIFLYGFVLVWFKLLSLEFDRKIAWLSLFAFLSFPTSFFAGGLYTESLFLFLAAASFLAAKQKKWALAGILAALLSATRVVGVAIVPALLLEYFEQKKTKTENLKPKQSLKLKLQMNKLWNLKISNFKFVSDLDFRISDLKPIFWILIGSLGLLSYMAYLTYEFSDPLYFLHVQAEFGTGRQESLILYPQVVWRYLKILWTYQPLGLKYYAYFQEFLSGTLILATIAYSYKFARKSWVLFSFLTFLIPVMTGTFSSLPRYVLVCLSIYPLIAQLSLKHKWFKYAYFSISTSLLILNTILFITGRWVA